MSETVFPGFPEKPSLPFEAMSVGKFLVRYFEEQGRPIQPISEVSQKLLFTTEVLQALVTYEAMICDICGNSLPVMMTAYHGPFLGTGCQFRDMGPNFVDFPDWVARGQDLLPPVTISVCNRAECRFLGKKKAHQNYWCAKDFEIGDKLFDSRGMLYGEVGWGCEALGMKSNADLLVGVKSDTSGSFKVFIDGAAHGKTGFVASDVILTKSYR